jgi:hypothetical protein
MAGKLNDHDTKPWPRVPRDLATFKPEQWDGEHDGKTWNARRQSWYGARLAVARSLNRPVLPEHQGLAAWNDRIDPRFPDVREPFPGSSGVYYEQ